MEPRPLASRREVLVRAAVGIGSLAAFLGVAAVLLLSDRAGRRAGAIKSFILDAGEAFEDAFGVDWLDRDSVPGTFDQIGHAVLWAAGMIVVGLTLRRWVHPVITALFLVAASIALEVLQAVYTQSRQFQESDVVGNAVGIGGGLVFVLLVGLLIDFVVIPIRNWLRDPSRSPIA